MYISLLHYYNITLNKFSTELGVLYYVFEAHSLSFCFYAFHFYIIFLEANKC